MASIRRHIEIAAPAERVWDAIRDFGAVDTRVARGFVVACVDAGDSVRVVTFSNGTTAREVLVDCDDEGKRLVYAVRSERVQHYNAALSVIAKDHNRSRIEWTVDVLPNHIADYIARQMDEAVSSMRSTLEGTP